MRLNQIRQVDTWPVWRKLLVAAGLTAVVIPGVLLIPDAFLLFLTLGLIVCALAGYWLGMPACLLVPLVAMGVEILIGIPATLMQPGGETPVSVILEAPFWTGVPSLIGALIGASLRARLWTAADAPMRSTPYERTAAPVNERLCNVRRN